MTNKAQKSAEVAQTHSAVEQKSTEVLKLIDAYAEARHCQGHSTYNAATAAARQAVVDALGGVQALSAAPGVPLRAIETLMNQAMGQAVANGANSVSMPDEIVEVAHWLAYRASPTPPAEQQATPGEVYAELRYDEVSRAVDVVVERCISLTQDGSGIKVVYDPIILSDALRAVLRDFADRTHALRMQQASPKAAPGERLTADQARAMVAEMDMHDAVLAGIDAETAPQQEAQEPDPATFALWYADHIGDENKPVRNAAWETYQAFAARTAPQPAPAPLPLSEDQRRALKEARDTAMEWSAKGRIPESGAFGAIAQNLDWLQAETSPQKTDAREEFERILQTKPDARFWNNYDAMLWAFVQGRAVQAHSPAPAPLSDDVVRDVRKALDRAFVMGQNYWADADSESYTANKRSDVTRLKFNTLRDEMCAALAAQGGQ